MSEQLYMVKVMHHNKRVATEVCKAKELKKLMYRLKGTEGIEIVVTETETKQAERRTKPQKGLIETLLVNVRDDQTFYKIPNKHGTLWKKWPCGNNISSGPEIWTIGCNSKYIKHIAPDTVVYVNEEI